MFQLKPNVLCIGQTGRLSDLNQSGIELGIKGVHNMVPQTPGLASLFFKSWINVSAEIKYDWYA